MVDSPDIPKPSERQGFSKERIGNYKDWLRTLEASVNDKKITVDEMHDMIARKLTAQELWIGRSMERAKKDALTGLPNLAGFREKYDKLIKEKKPFGLLMMDIDRFKKVNDSHGHLVGDRVIVQVALALTSALRQSRESEEENDTVARFGLGDELLVILPSVKDNQAVGQIAEKLRKAISDSPFSVVVDREIKPDKQKIVSIPITMSIGAGIYNTADTGDMFLQKVDEAMYEAKRLGRNRVFVAET